MYRRIVAALTLVTLLVAGCGQLRPLQSGDRIVTAQGHSQRQANGVTLLVKARVRSGKLYGTQALAPYTSGSIRLLVLTVTHSLGESNAYLAQGDLGSAIRLDDLKPGETYTLRFRAYQAEWAGAADLISDDGASTATITLDGSQPVVSTSLTVKLVDQLVDAKATGGLDIKAGNLVIPTVEATATAPDVSDFAGSSRGYLDGPGRFARFDTPHGLAIDASGSLFVADSGNRRVRKITSDGQVSTFSPYSASTDAMAGDPSNLVGFADGIALDASGNLTLADSRLGFLATLIEGATPSVIAGNGVVAHVDGENASASFDLPTGLLVESDGTVLVADTQNNCIRWITPSGFTYTWLGDPEPGLQGGFGRAVRFNHPTGMAQNASGDIFICDTDNHVIRKVDAAGEVSIYAGTGEFGDADGPALAARFDGPTGIAMDSDGSLLIADSNNNCIRHISAAGLVTTLSGSGISGLRNGPHVTAQYNHPTGLATAGQGLLYVADTRNHRVRKLRIR